MKTWTIPVAVGQQFVANEYVSACYTIKCTTPLNNATFQRLCADSNGNGIYDGNDTDKIVFLPEDYGMGVFSGCGGTHTIQIVGDVPTVANGFAVDKEKTHETEPLYYWYGSVIGENVDEGQQHIANLHCTDLSVPDAITYMGNMS